MKKLWFVLPAMLLVVFCFTQAAQAQYQYYDTEATAPTWSIHAGAAFLSGNAKNTSTWLAGLQYERPLGIEPTGGGRNALTLGADWISIDTISNGRQEIIPALVGYKAYRPLGGYNIFVDLGAGTRWASEDIPELRIDKGFGFGWKVGLGVNFTPQIFLESRYLAGSHPSDDGAWTIELGYNF